MVLPLVGKKYGFPYIFLFHAFFSFFVRILKMCILFFWIPLPFIILPLASAGLLGAGSILHAQEVFSILHSEYTMKIGHDFQVNQVQMLSNQLLKFFVFFALTLSLSLNNISISKEPVTEAVLPFPSGQTAQTILEDALGIQTRTQCTIHNEPKN